MNYTKFVDFEKFSKKTNAYTGIHVSVLKLFKIKTLF